MPDPAAPNPNPGHAKDPNFFAVVVMSAVAVLVFIVAACLFVMHDGKHLLPTTHPNPEPTSYLSVPGPHATLG
ncbi:MAG TPA: hypothetical protein VIY53_21130 [Acidobacteriaceae bacterium]